MQRSGETVSPKSQQNNLCLVCPGASRTYHCSLLFVCLVYSRGATAQFKVITHGFSSEFVLTRRVVVHFCLRCEVELKLDLLRICSKLSQAWLVAASWGCVSWGQMIS